MDFEPDNIEERPAGQNYFVKQDTGKIRLNFTINVERTSNEQWYSMNVQLGDGPP